MLQWLLLLLSALQISLEQLVKPGAGVVVDLALTHTLEMAFEFGLELALELPEEERSTT